MTASPSARPSGVRPTSTPRRSWPGRMRVRSPRASNRSSRCGDAAGGEAGPLADLAGALRLLALQEAERGQIGGAEAEPRRDGTAVAVRARPDRAHAREERGAVADLLGRSPVPVACRHVHPDFDDQTIGVPGGLRALCIRLF